MDVKYPQVTVKLIGEDSNAFLIIGRVAQALRAKVGSGPADAFTTAATNCGSYDELLSLAMQTVNVE